MKVKEACERFGAEQIFKEAHAKYGQGFASHHTGLRSYARWGIIPLYVERHVRDLSRQVACVEH